MPGNKKPAKQRRKVYNLVNPITHAIAGAAITDTAALDKLRLLELSALDAFVRGRATRDDWNAMADAANLAETMSREGIGPEALPACEAANEALSRVHARHKAGGSMTLDAEGIAAFRNLLEWYDLQRASVSRSEYERCIKKCCDRIRSAHPSVKVLM